MQINTTNKTFNVAFRLSYFWFCEAVSGTVVCSVTIDCVWHSQGVESLTRSQHKWHKSSKSKADECTCLENDLKELSFTFFWRLTLPLSPWRKLAKRAPPVPSGMLPQTPIPQNALGLCSSASECSIVQIWPLYGSWIYFQMGHNHKFSVFLQEQIRLVYFFNNLDVAVFIYYMYYR